MIQRSSAFMDSEGSPALAVVLRPFSNFQLSKMDYSLNIAIV